MYARQKSESRNGECTAWCKPAIPSKPASTKDNRPLFQSQSFESDYWRGVNNARARQEWAGLLASHTWSAFITSTASNTAIRKHPLSLIQHVRSKLSPRASDSWGVARGFVAAEEFSLGGWHCHGLVKWIDMLERPSPDNALADVSGRLASLGFVRVDAVKSVTDVSQYLSKYVIKNSPWEYDIWGPGWGLDKENGALI